MLSSGGSAILGVRSSCFGVIELVTPLWPQRSLRDYGGHSRISRVPARHSVDGAQGQGGQTAQVVRALIGDLERCAVARGGGGGGGGGPEIFCSGSLGAISYTR